MRPFSSTLLILATFFLTTALAKPLPYSLDDIERRWAEGHSEVEIHNGQTHRDMTPAWPIVRNSASGDSIGFTTDERTMRSRLRRQATPHGRREVDLSVVTQVKAFMADFLRRKEGEGMIGAREEDEEEVPVLKPKRDTRYSFTTA